MKSNQNRFTKRLFASLCLVLFAIPTLAQHSHEHTHDYRKIVFPDIPGYHTLSTDLHIHTVFSDGSVWPNIRTEEAVRDDIDVIAITDHLEYQPHEEDIPNPDRNRSYEIAQQSLPGDSDLIIINGSEITRDMPPGHSNAIFVEDANKLLQDDFMNAFREAKNQDAFVFWNHPHWTNHRKDGVARLSDLHKELIADGMLHGIEVVNMTTYSEEALQIALDYDLTILGTSDIHGLIDWEYDVHHGGHRPATLVFSEERSKEGLKESLMNGNTVVWYDDFFIGKEPFVIPLIEASLELSEIEYISDTSVLNVKITNHSSSKYILRNKSEYTLHQQPDVLTIEPMSVKVLNIKTLEREPSIELPFEVLNAVTAPDQHPQISFDIEIE
jgi:predicted metal-dependent phosphoesterase TrpH